MRRVVFFLLLATGSLTLAPITTSHADTIYTTDGKEVKGIVVEEYKDRIIFSTPDGEKTVMKNTIKDLYLDSEEDNLLKLADQARDKQDYTKAFVYYDMAFRINPASKAAKDGIVFLQGYLFRKEEADKESAVKRRNDVEEYGSTGATVKTTEEKRTSDVETLKKVMGITLKHAGPFPMVDRVMRDSPAETCGIKHGDLLVAVWGKLTGYMSLDEVMRVLLEKPALEIKCTIERSVDVKIYGVREPLANLNDLIGATFNVEFDGLTISSVRPGTYAQEAGLNAEDTVVSIDGNPTRYMALKKAVDLIKAHRGDTIKLNIRRDVLIWRRGEV